MFNTILAHQLDMRQQAHGAQAPTVSVQDRIRVIREAQRSCLAIAAELYPGQTEEFYLATIRWIVATERADRSFAENRILAAYRVAKRAAFHRLSEEKAGRARREEVGR